MNILAAIGLAAFISGSATVARAQFVAGNEAVTRTADGSKHVEAPPLPATGLAAPCPADRAGCAASGWRMLETPDGLKECTELFGRSGTCRPSTYGVEKRSRVWIVKVHGQWLQCQRPDIASHCVSIRALPIREVQ